MHWSFAPECNRIVALLFFYLLLTLLAANLKGPGHERSTKNFVQKTGEKPENGRDNQADRGEVTRRSVPKLDNKFVGLALKPFLKRTHRDFRRNMGRPIEGWTHRKGFLHLKFENIFITGWRVCFAFRLLKTR